jgi:hypothetical protein
MPTGSAGVTPVQENASNEKLEPPFQSSRNVLQGLIHKPISDETQITSGPIRIFAGFSQRILRSEGRMPELEHALSERARCAQPGFGRPKKQGRRRSMPSTTLPAPDIEIGSRHPV